LSRPVGCGRLKFVDLIGPATDLRLGVAFDEEQTAFRRSLEPTAAGP
jgi:hypothetical protein